MASSPISMRQPLPVSRFLDHRMPPPPHHPTEMGDVTSLARKPLSISSGPEANPEKNAPTLDLKAVWGGLAVSPSVI